MKNEIFAVLILSCVLAIIVSTRPICLRRKIWTILVMVMLGSAVSYGETVYCAFDFCNERSFVFMDGGLRELLPVRRYIVLGVQYFCLVVTVDLLVFGVYGWVTDKVKRRS